MQGGTVMPRPERLPSIPFGWYYVALRSVAHRRLITSHEDLARLLKLLRATLHRQGVRLHAGYVSERDVHLVLQLGEEPLSSITRRFQHDYARMFNRAHQEHGSLFRLHYRALLFEHSRWLVGLVHHVHWMSRRGVVGAERPGLWWSSDAVYRGSEKRGWVTTNVVLRMLTRGAYDRPSQEEAYRRLLDRPHAPDEFFPFRQARKIDSRILGEPEFIAAMGNRSVRQASGRTRRDAGELEAGLSEVVKQVIDRFLALCDARFPKRRATAWRRLVSYDNVRSASRRRPLPMVRALSASCLIEQKIATASQAARFLGCGSSPVSVRRRHFYEEMFRHLFGAELETLFSPRPARTWSRGSAPQRGDACL